MYMSDPPESTPPSQNIPPFQQQYATLPESTPPSQNIPLSTNVYYVRPSKNIPLPPWIYPPPPFSTTICDPPRIYPSLLEYTPPFQQMYMCDPPKIYSSLPPRIHPPFQQLNATFPESHPTFNNYNIMRCSQNLPLPHRIYPPPFSTTIYDPPRINPSLPKYTHFSATILLYHSPRIYPSLHLSQNIPPPPFQQLYATLTEITPPSENTPPPF